MIKLLGWNWNEGTYEKMLQICVRMTVTCCCSVIEVNVINFRVQNDKNWVINLQYNNIEMLLMDWLYDWFNMYGKTGSVPNN